MKDSFIKIENLCYSYDEDDGRNVPVLKNISLEIKKGEYIAVLGHNGSGKSTLAKLINMILLPTSGKIFFKGKDITLENMSDGDISFFHSHNLLPNWHFPDGISHILSPRFLVLRLLG